eukprot:208164-Pleurochrysis_carterae.AAC.1
MKAASTKLGYGTVRSPEDRLDSGALRFQHPPVLVTEHSTRNVHNDVAQRKEQPRRKLLREEIGQVVRTAHEGDGQLQLFNFLADKEMTAMNVFRTRVVLR